MKLFSFFKKKPIIPLRAVCFDLDNTLCNTASVEAETETYLCELIFTELRVLYEKPRASSRRSKSLAGPFTVSLVLNTFNTIKNKYLHHDESVSHYSRKFWFNELLHTLRDTYTLTLSPKKIEELSLLYEKRYWEFLTPKLTLYPGVVPLLESLRAQGIYTVLLTDSDGEKGIKIRRIVYLGLDKHFDYIITTDDTKKNKPAITNWHFLLNHLKLHGSECMMIGDHPEIDLFNAKKCGFITVWTKEQFRTGSHFSYVDYEISHISDVLKIVKKYR